MERTNSHHLLAAHGLRRTTAAALLACAAVLVAVAAIAVPGTAATVLVTAAAMSAVRHLRAHATTAVAGRSRALAE